MKVMHVGKYLPPVKGGMESSILHLCEHLHGRRGIEITLAAVGTANADPVVRSFSVQPLERVFTLASTPIARGLRTAIRETRPDLIHVHLPNPWMTQLLRREKTPLIATYHCDIISYPFLKKAYLPLLHAFLENCRAIIATSPQLIEHNPDLQRHRAKTRMISLSAAPITRSPAIEARARELAQAARGRAVVFVGRLVAYKGLGYLIDAMADVDAHLYIVGSGRERGSLQARARDRGLLEKITFTGEVTDAELPAYLHAARVVVLPSVSEAEALGISLIEALSVGRPLLTTDLRTGVRHVNENGVTGIVVPPRDPAALAHGLRAILDDPATEARFRENALHRYRHHFGTDAIVEAHLDLYEKVKRA